MAVDEALLAGDGPPTLRLYRWRPHGLSLGYFQRHADFDAETFGREGIVIVRRLTGGGAILHADEVTFSIVAPLSEPLFAGPVRRSYERVHAILAKAIERCGARAEPRGGRALPSDEPGSKWCYSDSTDVDLVCGDRKLVGSAQRRTGGRVLHHGSIVIRAPRHAPETASLDAAGGETRPDVVEETIAATFAESLAIELRPRELSTSEASAARDLAASRYADPAWTRWR